MSFTSSSPAVVLTIATSGLLPLCFGAKSPSNPRTVVIGLGPGYAVDWAIFHARLLPRTVVAFACNCAASRCHTGPILVTRNLSLVNGVGVQFHEVVRQVCRLAGLFQVLIATHPELACGHLYSLRRAEPSARRGLHTFLVNAAGGSARFRAFAAIFGATLAALIDVAAPVPTPWNIRATAFLADVVF